MRLSSLAFLVAAVLPGPALQAQSRKVAITIDDLPYVTGYASRPMSRSDAHAATISNMRLLDVLAKHHVPVTGFVIEKSLESIGRPAGRGILRDWIDEGFDLGNHSYAHLDFNKLTAAEMEDQILRGEATIDPLMHDAGRQLQFFRFPFNHTGDTLAKHETLAAFLAQHKYRLAPCTIENEDWMFAESFFRMRAHYKDADARRLIDDYLRFTGAQIDYFAALNKQIFGYEPPEILLIHDNALNAETMDRLLGLFEARGYQFVSLTEAESDPAYSTPESFVTSYGPMWGYRWAKVKGIPVDGRKEPDPPGWIVHYEVPRTTPLHHKG